MGGSSFGKKFGKITTSIVDPFGIGKSKFGKTVMKVVDPLNIMDPMNVLPGKGEKWGTYDKNYGGAARGWLGLDKGSGGGNLYKPRDYSSLQKMSENNQSNQMVGDMLMQKQMTDQALASQQTANLQTANSQQQQNINSAMQNSKQNLNNSLMRTPVPSTFSKNTPASTNQFKLPNVAGLTFRK
jgi:hypothetical protein